MSSPVPPPTPEVWKYISDVTIAVLGALAGWLMRHWWKK